jgi:hypothetical protein
MTTMKKILFTVLLISSIQIVKAQDGIQTIFNGSGGSGGYGAISNKFTYINGEFANMVEVYGGWYVGHKLLIGAGAAATTNFIEVPREYSTRPDLRMSYEYGQVGFVTEYAIASNRAVHVNFHLMTGAGFTLQYERPEWGDWEYHDYHHYDHNENWFFVVEPGVQVELNLLKWMRFSPGVSYRFTDGSEAAGLSDSDLQGMYVNLTLKFGKF